MYHYVLFLRAAKFVASTIVIVTLSINSLFIEAMQCFQYMLQILLRLLRDINTGKNLKNYMQDNFFPTSLFVLNYISYKHNFK